MLSSNNNKPLECRYENNHLRFCFHCAVIFRSTNICIVFFTHTYLYICMHGVLLLQMTTHLFAKNH